MPPPSPRAEDEQKLNRYNRANHLRRQCEFDKALAAYEKLLETDDGDAEAHWGAAISRYGIEYVQDPASGRRVPTCHRLQVASILADPDYRAAVAHAPDEASRDLYRAQAQEIAELQKGILAISAGEKPYDVFICYKETDEPGQRTRDSALAQEVYYGLTEQGYKVFFSRITLEDKLGREYEPYIFAALNSARMMLVIGTKPEHFSAVWVKNEWSRYLALMAQDRKRLLIPCYRDMDPYDLPEELSNLQSQDMGRIGFMQDLLRGVKKVLDADRQPEPAPVRQAAPAAELKPGTDSLLVRSRLFLEDGDFASADEYLNRVLDLDPKCAQAYVLKVCAALGLRGEEALSRTPFLYADSPDWQKALRFADEKQASVYRGYLAGAQEKVDAQVRRYAYDCAMELAVTPGADRAALDRDLAAYRESCGHSTGERADGSRRKNAERNEAAFREAVERNDPGWVDENRYMTAAEMFDAVGTPEAAACAKQCRTMLDVIMDGRYQSVMHAMRTAGNSSFEWNKIVKQLSHSNLYGYRDTEELLAQAKRQYAECLAAEKEAERVREENQRKAAEAASKRKKGSSGSWQPLLYWLRRQCC